MKTAELLTLVFNALCETLNVKPQADVMALSVAVPNGVDISKPLDHDAYLLWRDKFVHDFWMDRAWITRDTDCPLDLFEQAHRQSLAKIPELA